MYGLEFHCQWPPMPTPHLLVLLLSTFPLKPRRQEILVNLLLPTLTYPPIHQSLPHRIVLLIEIRTNFISLHQLHPQRGMLSPHPILLVVPFTVNLLDQSHQQLSPLWHRLQHDVLAQLPIPILAPRFLLLDPPFPTTLLFPFNNYDTSCFKPFKIQSSCKTIYLAHFM